MAHKCIFLDTLIGMECVKLFDSFYNVLKGKKYWGKWWQNNILNVDDQKQIVTYRVGIVKVFGETFMNCSEYFVVVVYNMLKRIIFFKSVLLWRWVYIKPNYHSNEWIIVTCLFCCVEYFYLFVVKILQIVVVSNMELSK